MADPEAPPMMLEIRAEDIDVALSRYWCACAARL